MTNIPKDIKKISKEQVYLLGFADGLKRARQLLCPHQNTIDIGDEEHSVIACTDCEMIPGATLQDFIDDAIYCNGL